jgi:predicted amidohydrolase
MRRGLSIKGLAGAGWNGGPMEGNGMDATASSPAPALLRVGVVQFVPPAVANRRRWDGWLRPWLDRAAAAGCDLVLFPAFPWPAAASPLAGEPAAELAAVASDLAREFRLILAPGAIVGAGQREALLFGPDGGLLGRQAQTHIPPEERGHVSPTNPRGSAEPCSPAGLVPGATLDPIPLPPPAPAGLRAGFLVGLDAWYPEVARILTLKGAALLLAPIAMPAPYNPWRQLAATWQQVQQNQVFGLEACAAGVWNSAPFAGRSAAFAPCEMSPGATGVLAQVGVNPAAAEVAAWGGGGMSSGAATDEALIVADLDFGALQTTVDAYPLWERQNAAFYARYFPKVYAEGGAL